ncbi:MAG: hypothetical protein ACD_43C00217G0002 [uncultured bacterium]|nr:MAG: hypothetical protein ACD_43C00217G0002 [uncultured bacterium]
MSIISVVVPVYKCADCLVELYERLQSTIITLGVEFELILVDDGSPDSAWSVISSLAQRDYRIIGVQLSRNFGQHYAITAGLQHATGDWIVVMDGDLQDEPEDIAKLFNTAQTGFDVVLASRAIRIDSWLKRFSSRCFYIMLSYLTDLKQDATVGNFGIYRRTVIQVLNNMQENLRYFPAMVRWTGFPTTSIEVKHASRVAGKSSYTFRKLLHLALDVMLAFSDKPLRLTIKVGLAIACTSFGFALYIIILSVLGTRPVPGWPSLIVSIWLLAGLIIMLLGMIGLYVGKIFDQVKHRPLYIVRSTLNYKSQ